MKLEESFDLPHPRETAWAAFQDVEMLVSCLPGASLASAPGADPLELGLAVKLGPIAANFTGQGKLTYGSDYKGVLEGGGTDRGTGSRVKGAAAFELHENDGGTRVRLSIDYALTGALAQFGRSGIVKELAAGITRQFAANLRSKLGGAMTGTANTLAASGAAGSARLDAGALLWSVLKEKLRSMPGSPAAAVDRPSGLAALLAVRPQWTMLAAASTLIPLKDRWLLHAGPPLADALSPPAPLLSSAVLACLYEGWAATEEEAEVLLRSGEIRLVPAQDHCCVTPLAAVVSPSTAMIVVEDAARLAAPTCAPLGAIGGPDTRFGTRDHAIVERLRMRDGKYAPTLAAALNEPVDLMPIAAHAIAAGDDLHNRTTTATEILAAELARRYRSAGIQAEPYVERLLDGLTATPLFFLTFWMAAAKLMLCAAENGEPATLVTRMGGNGEVFGISLAGQPDAWITIPAAAPKGAFLQGVDTASVPLGAIGDSAVIDALGCGGQALHLAPEPRSALQAFLPAGGSSLQLAAAHPAFARSAMRVGLDATDVAASAVGPVVTLAMVEKTGRKGLLGRGVFLPGTELFVRAMKMIA